MVGWKVELVGEDLGYLVEESSRPSVIGVGWFLTA
jgi:hypothetical protein